MSNDVYVIEGVVVVVDQCDYWYVCCMCVQSGVYDFGNGDEFSIGFVQLYIVGIEQEQYVVRVGVCCMVQQFGQFGVMYFVYVFVYEFILLCGQQYVFVLQFGFVDDDVIVECGWLVELGQVWIYYLLCWVEEFVE